MTNDSQHTSTELYQQSPLSFLSLPPEIRLHIYSLVIECSGVVTIFARHAIGKNVSKQTLCLLHLNQLIRSEVEDFFYANQEFSFRSMTAIESFVCDIGTRRIALIRKITFDQWLCSRFYAQFNTKIMEMLRTFSGLEEVMIEEPLGSRGWSGINRTTGFLKAVRFSWSQPVELGPGGYLILGTWENFLSGKIVLRRQGIPPYVYWHRPNGMVFLAPDSPRYETVETESKPPAIYVPPVPKQSNLVQMPDPDEVRKELHKLISPEYQQEVQETKAREKRKARQRQRRY